jgi:FkbM family methyltransferase
MSTARRWTGNLLLHSSAPLRSLRHVPVMGEWIHRLSHRLLPPGETIWAQVEAGPAQGLWLELNPRTGQSYLRGDAEARVQKIVEERLHPGMVFYDLGANIGLFSLLAARRVYPSGRVFSFEPDPGAAARLRRNVAKNCFPHVEVVEAGVWSESGSINFVPAGASSPDHGTGRLVATTDSCGVPVHCVALDDFTRGKPPDGIKCDVEGAEVEVFRGASKMIETHRPWILCEMHSHDNERASCELLARLAYRFERVDSNHILALP